ncbi:hypothetical protein NP493_351g03026 [Ridgeia piscesae]|uniref:malate synthase n=1 Tax=Ridgeia piscesae TaxID=27915 RepID=A0AAD9NU51_RIDPI|nr:hypothetical protein NP493_351g03026 [Ridgeia piscesae]
MKGEEMRMEIQTDFDDGHCPSWRNQLTGLYNVYRAVHNEIPDVPDISSAPVLMLRPRAWNMIEHNMMVSGKKVPGPLFDFGLLMYHNAQILVNCDSGPFFYLPKLEGYLEARLWNNVFTWTEQKLSLPSGCVKACVLIENVLASFELHEILYELRDHSAGLNCGIWDYSASFVNKLGTRPDFMLPDRNKYVSMDKHFLKSYMDLVIQTCHGHGALATGGMSALLLPSGDKLKYQEVMEKACSAKLKEIQAGADGYMVYDLGLVTPMQQLFREHTPGPNQLEVLREDVKVTAEDLLRMPPGGVTLGGLKHNIAVGILFIEAWLRGRGHFYFKGCVEDSATAEISRSQVWQWLRHRAPLEDASTPTVVTRRLVHQLIRELLQQMFLSVDHSFTRNIDRCHLVTAAGIFEEVVTKRDFPEFITTYLYEEHAFLMEQANMESGITGRKSKL